MNDHKFHRHIDLDDGERQRLLEDLDAAKAAMESGRANLRHEFHATEVPLVVKHPDGRGESRFLVYGRNISRGGIGVIHAGYVTIGAECQIVLPRAGGKPMVAAGVVSHCRLVAGSWHELGIRFRSEIDPAIIAGVPLNDEQSVGDAHGGDAPRDIILVAESFEPERDLMLHQLTMCGLSTRGVGTAGATLDVVQRESVKLVVSGLSVASDDGLRTIQRLREMGFDRPIMMATADPDPQVAIWAREAGATSVVTKPINVDLLVAQIRTHVDPRPPGKEIFSTVGDQPGMPQLVDRFVVAARQVVEQLDLACQRGELVEARDPGHDALGENRRQRRDGAGVDRDEAQPPDEEARDGMNRLAQIHIVPAGARVHGAELGVGQGAREREQRARRPRGHDPARGGQQRRDLGRREEDAAADHRRDDEHGRVRERELALESVSGVSGGRVGHRPEPYMNAACGNATAMRAHVGNAMIAWGRRVRCAPIGHARIEGAPG